MTEPDARRAPGVRPAGAVFVGPHTPEAFGDYLAGPNHVLPTGGTARFASPRGLRLRQAASLIEAGAGRLAPAGPGAGRARAARRARGASRRAAATRRWRGKITRCRGREPAVPRGAGRAQHQGDPDQPRRSTSTARAAGRDRHPVPQPHARAGPRTALFDLTVGARATSRSTTTTPSRTSGSASGRRSRGARRQGRHPALGGDRAAGRGAVTRRSTSPGGRSRLQRKLKQADRHLRRRADPGFLARAANARDEPARPHALRPQPAPHRRGHVQGLARALDAATQRDPRLAGVPSTKGTLG